MHYYHGAQIAIDKYIYSKFIDSNTFVIIYFYVDDKLIPSSNTGTIDETMIMLVSNFVIKDMREATAILSIKITKTSDGLIVSQN